MARSPALKELAEQISLICSKYRRLQKRYSELDARFEKLSARSGGKKGPAAGAKGRARATARAGSQFDKNQVQSKLEEMLAELADIG